MTGQKLELTVLRPNPEIKPSFAEGTPFLLKKITHRRSLLIVNGVY